MAAPMTHRERVAAALNGQSVDRPPISAWRHFYSQENTAEDLAEAMLRFQREYEWDFMKVNPRASYHVEDWGVVMRFSDSDAEGPSVERWPVKRAEDWDAVKPLEVTRGVLGEQLEALRRIAAGLAGQVPYLMTVFTPLSIAERLAGSPDAMLRYLRHDTRRVQDALQRITDTFIEFGRECLAIGASGTFFATTGWATRDAWSEAEYREVARPYDLRFLQALDGAEFHLLHVCRSNNMLAAFADYPVAALNWDSQDQTNPSLAEGARLTGKCVVGGVSHRTLLSEGTPQEVAAQVQEQVGAMTGSRWMLGTGCTYAPDVPEANVRALRAAVDPG